MIEKYESVAQPFEQRLVELGAAVLGADVAMSVMMSQASQPNAIGGIAVVA